MADLKWHLDFSKLNFKHYDYRIYVVLAVSLVVILGVVLFGARDTELPGNLGVGKDYKNAEYIIDGKTVLLVNGVSEVEAAPGSSAMITTRYFGNEVRHDLNGDGREDVVFLLTQNSGGSGTFYYAVAALNTLQGYIGSQGLLLGDRIAPQSSHMSQNPRHQNVIVVNYADRARGEPMTAKPSVGKSIWLKLDPKIMQFGEVVQNFEGESR